MAKLSILAGTTSKLLRIFVQNSSVTTGAGLTGLAFNTVSLTGYYIREGSNATTQITLATQTLGTWATGGFIVVDGTNMPGMYEISIPNAAIAAGAKSVAIYYQGATNMAPVVLEVELTAVDNQSTGFGLAAIAITSNVKKNQALNSFPFIMYNSTTNAPMSGLTVTATRSIDGAAFAACANSASEIGNGNYVINLANTDLNGNCIMLQFTATGANTTFLGVVTQP